MKHAMNSPINGIFDGLNVLKHPRRDDLHFKWSLCVGVAKWPASAPYRAAPRPRITKMYEMFVAHVSCPDVQKSLWERCHKPDRKSAILYVLFFFHVFGVLQGPNFNELLLDK